MLLYKFIFLATAPYLVTANTGHLGLNLAKSIADLPVVVTTIIPLACAFNEASTADMQIACAGSTGGAAAFVSVL
uniref:Putative secreted protein n=1 Tax=Panstrongylus lignarius TaxID=156445 RepID=A0A224XTP8_9HEMI